MADHTITLTATQETGLTFATNKLNVQRAAENPPKSALTEEQYLQAMIKNVINDYVKQKQDEETMTIKDKYASLTPAVQAQIKALMGL